jgi:uncharacterized membrane protein
MQRANDLLPDAYMRPSTVISGLTALLVLAVHRDITRLTAGLTIIGLLGTLGIIFTSEFFNVPINRVVHSWKDDYVSPDYPKMLAKWGFFHAVRTSSSLLALGCYLVAGLVH